MAGALTGGFLQIRSGLKPAFRSAVFGGVLLVRGRLRRGRGGGGGARASRGRPLAGDGFH
jgi:hypothetical protein